MVTDDARRWVVLLYHVPPRPSAGRVGIWRKLKRLGALLLHDSAWVLPAAPRTLEQFQWLVAEIAELGGEATLWQGTLCLDGQEDELVQRFRAQVEELYADIERALTEPTRDLALLSRRYQQAHQQDFFQSECGHRIRAALVGAEGAN